MENKTTDHIVKVSNLEKAYNSGRFKYEVLKGLNFEVKRGEFVSIMGPSGSGKTTLLNQIGALDKPSKGEVLIDGIKISDYKESRLYEIRREKIGFIFQNFYLVSTLSSLENVLLPTLPLKKSVSYTKRAKNLLKTVGLGDKIDYRPNQLSGGQMQRVAIARALVLNPPLVLADEPTGSLDTKTGKGIIDLMRDLNKKEGKTFVIVTHNEELAGLCDNVIKLKDGKIVK